MVWYRTAYRGSYELVTAVKSRWYLRLETGQPDLDVVCTFGFESYLRCLWFDPISDVSVVWVQIPVSCLRLCWVADSHLVLRLERFYYQSSLKRDSNPAPITSAGIEPATGSEPL